MRRIHSGVAYGGKLYVIGGYSGGTPLGDVLDFSVTSSSLGGIGGSLHAEKATAVHLTWTAASGATAYDVRRCDAGGGPCTPATIAGTANLYYNDAVPGDASNYWYEIVATNGECEAP